MGLRRFVVQIQAGGRDFGGGIDSGGPDQSPGWRGGLSGGEYVRHDRGGSRRRLSVVGGWGGVCAAGGTCESIGRGGAVANWSSIVGSAVRNGSRTPRQHVPRSGTYGERG